jgi:hypothetical protein
MDRCCYLFDFGGKNGVFAERECWRLRKIYIDIPLAQPQQQVIPEPYSFFEPRAKHWPSSSALLWRRRQT